MANPLSIQTKPNKSPIFIVGSPRSGTTLTAKILGRHQNIFSPGESHYFEDIWTRRQKLGNLQSKEQISQAVIRVQDIFSRFNFPKTQELVDEVIQQDVLIEETYQHGGGYATLYYTFMRLLANSQGKSRFCDDTPKHLFHLDTILEFFPQAKIIVCIRDPRDYLCSYKNYWQRSTESERVKVLYHPILTTLLWRSSTNILLKHLNQTSNNTLTLLHYEALVQNPVVEVSRLCDFLNLAYSDDLIQVDSHNSSFGESSSGIFTSAIGRWHKCLQAEEAWWVQTLVKNQMQALNYPLEPLNPAINKLILSIINLPLTIIKAIKVNKHKIGPLPQYIAKRLKSLVGQ